MSTSLYLSLSALMFMEFAVWGAWMPVLAARLLGPLKMTGKQVGWIYATLPMACMVSPLVFGSIADNWIDARWILLGCHAIGAVLLFLAARTQRFGPLFTIMLLYSVAYAATLPLVNAILFRYVSDATWQGYVFIWAPVAWALIGYFLTGLRQLKGTGDGSDCLYLGAALSVVMAAVCLFQPDMTPQAQATQPLVAALGMLQDPNYLLFILVSLAVAGMMQFYFLGTAPFMQDMGISSKNVPGAMAMAQAVQALATFFLLGLMLKYVGPKWTLAVGSACWFLLYVFYVLGRPTWMIVSAQGLHGLAYVFFMIAGQIYVGMVAKQEIMASAQSLIFLATTGIGLFLGTQLAGFVMEKNNVGGKFQWSKVWLVPLTVCLAGALTLAAFFNDKPPAPQSQPAPQTTAAPELPAPRV